MWSYFVLKQTIPEKIKKKFSFFLQMKSFVLRQNKTSFFNFFQRKILMGGLFPSIRKPGHIYILFSPRLCPPKPLWIRVKFLNPDKGRGVRFSVKSSYGYYVFLTSIHLPTSRYWKKHSPLVLILENTAPTILSMYWKIIPSPPHTSEHK